MTLPDRIQQLIEENLAEIRNNPEHVLLPIKRHAIYNALNLEYSDNLAQKWLEILTVKHILPFWKAYIEWEEYPSPEELVSITEAKLSGKIANSGFTDAESLGAEMVSLTNEPVESPYYPIWSVFRAAVSLYFRAPFSPDEYTSDTKFIKRGWEEANQDVATFALIAYACRTNNPITDPQELKDFWVWWYFERDEKDNTPIPWKHYFDPTACLEFWEWWLIKAIPQACELAAG